MRALNSGTKTNDDVLWRSRARPEINLTRECGCKLLCMLLRRTSLELHENWRSIYTTRECAQTKRQKEGIAMMEWEERGYMRCCEEQCEAIQVRKERMYRLNGT